MKILRFLVVASLFLGMTAGGILAAAPNNKFGIHLAQPHLEDLKAAAQLINSSGGDWGYVTLVIQENDRNKEKWQEIFDRLREYHLIPIIRLAAFPDGDKWRRPKKEEAESWVKFLDSLNWVVKNRYIILFNEPNHASEWGGKVDAEDYAQVAFELAKKLKEKNPDFFIMLAGLDASAPHAPPQFEDEEIFLKVMIKSEILNSKSETNSNYQNPNDQNKKNCFEFSVSCFEFLIDGWVSHSYPNPNFSGSPWDVGRGTVRTYQWEWELLKNFGVEKQLPVFITETGWIKKVISYQLTVIRNELEENTVADYFKIAYEQVWLPDQRLVAVTPFVFNYQSEPFLGFSWKLPGGNFYQQYYTVQSLAKVKGEPEQVEKGRIIVDWPKELVAESDYNFKIKLKNFGQAIWGKDNSYELEVISDEGKNFEYLFEDLKGIKPFEEEEIGFVFKTNKNIGKQKLKFVLQKNERKILESKDWQFEILPLPSLKFEVGLFPKLKTEGKNFEIQIFDKKEKLVFKKKNLTVKVGLGIVNEIQNIVLGEKYRLVILKPYYLPRQEFVTFKKGENKTKFEPMLPLDFNLDGKLSFGDFKALIKNPKLLKLFLFY